MFRIDLILIVICFASLFLRQHRIRYILTSTDMDFQSSLTVSPVRNNKLKKGTTSISTPEYVLMNTSAEDEHAMNQRAKTILMKRNLNPLNLPPPTKFIPVFNHRNQLMRSLSSDHLNHMFNLSDFQLELASEERSKQVSRNTSAYSDYFCPLKPPTINSHAQQDS